MGLAGTLMHLLGRRGARGGSALGVKLSQCATERCNLVFRSVLRFCFSFMRPRTLSCVSYLMRLVFLVCRTVVAIRPVLRLWFVVHVVGQGAMIVVIVDASCVSVLSHTFMLSVLSHTVMYRTRLL